jgi:hypothetical protein
MVECIDKGGLIKFLDNLQQPKIPITEGFKYITIDDAIKIVSERPAANVIPIPDGATNGDMIKAMFPELKVEENIGSIYMHDDNGILLMVQKKMWNAPYIKSEE